jgi:hypothetical protein
MLYFDEKLSPAGNYWWLFIAAECRSFGVEFILKNEGLLRMAGADRLPVRSEAEVRQLPTDNCPTPLIRTHSKLVLQRLHNIDFNYFCTLSYRRFFISEKEHFLPDLLLLL